MDGEDTHLVHHVLPGDGIEFRHFDFTTEKPQVVTVETVGMMTDEEFEKAADALCDYDITAVFDFEVGFGDPAPEYVLEEREERDE